MDSPVANLFDQVPERIFRPLAANEHSRRNWAMLSHLYYDFFAPEAEPPEADGWTQKRVAASIERFLLRWDDIHGVDLVEQSTPLNVRAHNSLRNLIECEWLSVDRVGFSHYVIMKPTVQSLFELLSAFASQGPEFIGGRVQSIRNNLKQVQLDPSVNASVFQVAAKECAALLRMLNTTRMRVREASELLRQQNATHEFLHQFFEGYIAELYIGDFSELFSRNHPLASRWEIIDLANQIVEHTETRDLLRAWYRKNMRCRNNDEAEALIDADAARVLALRDVDRLLTRLKDAVTRANEQALGYLEYKVRSQGDFDLWVNQCIAAIVRADDTYTDKSLAFNLGWSQGKLLSEDALKLPTSPPRQRKGALIQKRKLSPEAQVRRLIRQIMKGHREVSEQRIVRLIERHIAPGEETDTASLRIESINDLCIVATFSRLGLVAERAMRNRDKGLRRPRTLGGLETYIEWRLAGDRFENQYLEAPNVKIRLKQRWEENHGR